MTRLIIFLLLSIPIIAISWRSLSKLTNHGFYRFLSWECILWLAISVVPFWFNDPFSIHQIISWIILFVSIYVLVAGVMMMKKAKKPQADRKDDTLYAFEKTSEIVDKGIFGYIRHPMYCSLLLLTWGMYFKSPDLITLAVSVASTAFLFLTAYAEEKEDIAYFGDAYRDYMKRTKMFIPFVI
jgi:protein-S-isoprenylcysteine O-methyltransferase Ste14